MKGIDDIHNKALELKESGMSDKEIARELHLSENTIVWLLTKKVESKPPEVDVKIGWKSLGVYGHRMSSLSSIFSDIILEEAERRDFEVDTVVGVAINGIPLAAYISEELGLEFSVYRPSQNTGSPGTLSSNFAMVDGKNIVVVDDFIGSGETMKKSIKDLKGLGANPMLALIIVNKTDMTDIDQVPVRSFIRARPIA
ncbi:MAG: orotate phosphoribosyltransferase-like protein [Thermoplasmata archaeon]|nr:orotate phosphoribosyltransferase-like protein [Thermoplasmata archaeon]